MIDYQEQEELQGERREPEGATFATVGAVYNDGVSLIFDGEETPTEKHYKVNAFVVFKANDRVRIIKDSGTYVVEYPIGSPKTSFNADTADRAAYATGATNATKATNAEKAITAQKLELGRTISLAGDASGNATFDGSKNISINATVNNAKQAVQLKTARNIKLTGDVTGSARFSGAADANIAATCARSTAVKNAYRPTTSSWDVYFYSTGSGELYYKIGSSGALHRLQNA